MSAAVPTVSALEISKRLGVTSGAVSQWAKTADFPKRQSDNKWKLEEVLAWRTRQNNIQARSARWDEGHRALKIKHLQLKCDEEQFELEAKKRVYIHRDEVRADITSAVKACTTRLLAIPGKLAPVVIGQNAADAERAIRAEVIEALKELSEGEWS